MLAWCLVAFGIFLIGLTKSGFGSGSGLVIVPLTALALAGTSLGSRAALGLLLPLLVLGDLIALWQYRREFHLPLIWALLPGTLVGLILGGFLLAWFSRHSQGLAQSLIQIEIGLESMLLVGIHWWKGRLSGGREPLRSHVTGVCAGVSSTLAHAAGPIIALYLLPRGLDRRRFVGTGACYFFLLNAAKLPVYAVGHQFIPGLWPWHLGGIPLVIVGAGVGRWINGRMRDELFSRLVSWITFLLGGYMLWLGLRGLLF